MVAPTAARMMRPTAARMFRPNQPSMAGFIYRDNRVPYYQRLFQQHDGKRQWWKTSRSPYMLYPFYVALWSSLGFSVYGGVRMVFGHKTLW